MRGRRPVRLASTPRFLGFGLDDGGGSSRSHHALSFAPTGRVRQPPARRLIDQGRQALADAGVVTVKPRDFVCVHQLPVDEPQVDRRERKSLKSEHFALAPTIVRGSTTTRFSIRIPNAPGE